MLFLFSLFIILVSFLDNANTQKIGAGSCVDDLNLGINGGCCVSNETCCTPGGCCCEQNCYDFGDCCLDVWVIDCPPTEEQTDIPMTLYTCADVYGTTDGCCTDNCRNNYQLCRCDQACYNYGDCCGDIMDIGCKCNFTCYDHYGNSSGCCEVSDEEESCDTSCCKCDQDCHARGDCCMDIEEWGCYPPTEPPIVINYCPENTTTHDNGSYVMTWSQALPGNISYQVCDPPKNGTASRDCSDDGIWGEPYIIDCGLTILQEIMLELDELNITSPFPDQQADAVSNITEILINITADPFTHVYSSDVRDILQILFESITVLQDGIGFLDDPFLETQFVDVFNNLFEERYNEVYQLFINSSGGSNDLIFIYEAYANYAAMFTVEYEDSEFTIDRERLVFNVKVANNGGQQEIKFPDDDDDLMSFNITSENYPKIYFARSDLNAFSSGRVAIVNTLITKVADYLYNDFETSDTEISSIILSSVISSSTQSGSLPATLDITTEEYFEKNLTNTRCAFWDPSRNDGYGEWSTDGIVVTNRTTITDDSNYTTSNVLCTIYHQTPFVVLVDVNDIQYADPEEEYALEIVGLIGVSVSILFLILTILFLMFLGKQMVLSTQYFIHFNLSIALLGGYVTFLLFIDDRIIDVTNSQVGCAIVAGALHFFFTAAFSWMMCEGIMLFLLLVVVFSSIGKRWYLFLIIGWGIPVIPVAISAGLIHDQYGSPGEHCWIDVNESKAAIWAFVGPMLLILLINVFFLIMAIRALMLYHRRKQRELNKKVGYTVFRKSIIGTLTLLPLLGITWAIGLLAVDENTTVFAWLFVVLNSLQGLFIFIFNIARNDKIRQSITKRCYPKRRKMKKSKSASIIRRSDSFAQKRPTSGEFIMSAPPTKRSMVYSDDIEDEDPADYYYDDPENEEYEGEKGEVDSKSDSDEGGEY